MSTPLPLAATSAPPAFVPRKVVMIGSFPPPVGGAARNNAMLAQSLEDSGVDVRRVNTSGVTASHYRTLAYHLRRLGRNAKAAARAFAWRSRKALLYLVPDGGEGAWYSLAHAAVASGGYGQVVLHHHTFRYIRNVSRPIATLVRVLPREALHVFLSPGMAAGFQQVYGEVRHMVASNARFVADEAGRPPLPRAPGPLRFGHLSNLSWDKGFFEVADTFDAVRAAGLEVELHLAGPVLDDSVQQRLDQLLAAAPGQVRHYGPVYGTAKRDFYRDIDLFLFPTNFDQEAAPSVVYEALSAGKTVLATGLGCLPEMLIGERGAVLPPLAAFAPAALAYLRDFDASSEALHAGAVAIKAEMREESARSRSQYEALMRLMGATEPGHFVQEY